MAHVRGDVINQGIVFAHRPPAMTLAARMRDLIVPSRVIPVMLVVLCAPFCADATDGMAAARLFVVNGQDTLSVVDAATGGRATVAFGDGIAASAVFPSPFDDVAYVVNDRREVAVLDTLTNEILARIAALSVSDVAFNPNGRFAYLVACGTITVVDAVRHASVKVLQGVPREPFDGIRFSADGARMYMSSTQATLVIDTARHEAINKIEFDNFNPQDVVPDPAGSRLYLSRGNVVRVLDLETGKKIEDITVTGGARRFVVAPAGAVAYAWSQELVSVVDLARARTTDFFTARWSGSPIFSPDGTKAYLPTADGVQLLDTRSHQVSAWVPGVVARELRLADGGARLFAATATDLVEIDAATGRHLSTTVIDGSLLAVADTPKGVRAYIAGASGLSIVDLATGTVLRTLVSFDPFVVTVSADGEHAFVAQHRSGLVQILDASSLRAVAQLGPLQQGNLPLYPIGVGVDATDSDKVWVAYRTDRESHPGSVAVFDRTTGSLEAQILIRDPDPEERSWGVPTRILLSPNGSTAYVALSHGRVAIIDARARRLNATVEIESNESEWISALALSPDGATLYGTVTPGPDAETPYLAIIDVNDAEVTAVIPLPFESVGSLVLAPDGALAYALQSDWYDSDQESDRSEGHFISVLDLGSESLTTTIPLPSAGASIAIDGTGRRAYVSLPSANQIAVVNLTEGAVERLIDAGPSPSALALAPVAGVPLPPLTPTPIPTPAPTVTPRDRLLVLHDQEQLLSIVDGGHIRGLPLGGKPLIAKVSHTAEFAWIVTESGTPNEPKPAVAVVDLRRESVVGTIALDGWSPKGIAVTPDDALVYVVAGFQDHMAAVVIDAATRAVATWIPLGRWSTGAIDFSSDGTYGYVAIDEGIAIIDTRTSRVVQHIAADADIVSIVPAAHDRIYALGDSLLILDTESGEVLQRAAIPTLGMSTAAVASDGRVYIGSSSCSRFVSVYDVPEQRIVTTIPVTSEWPAPLLLAASADGRYVYVTTSRGVAIVDAEHGAVAGEIVMHRPATGIALIADAGFVPPLVRTPPTLLPTATQTPTSTWQPRPREEHWIEVGHTTAVPGRRVEIPIVIHANGEYPLRSVEYAISFETPLRVASWIDGRPDCSGFWGSPEPESFELLPVGCESGVSCTNVHWWWQGNWWFGEMRYRCAFDVAADAVPGRYPLSISGVGTVNPRGEWIELLLDTVDGSVTVAGEPKDSVEPTATPAPEAKARCRTDGLFSALVCAGNIRAQPGQTATAAVSIHSNGHNVAGASVDLLFPEGTAVLGNTNGDPRCSGSTAFAFVPDGCEPGRTCRSVRSLYVSFDLEPIVDGVWFTCQVQISADAQAGRHALRVTAASASDSSGRVLPIVAADGSIVIDSPTIPPTPSPRVAANLSANGTVSEQLLQEEWSRGCRLARRSADDSGYFLAAPLLILAVCRSRLVRTMPRTRNGG